MMKFKYISRNFDKLQRFSAFSTKSESENLRKSEQISLKSAEFATKFEQMQSF